MEYKFLINDFEGPLDLLLHLIKKNNVDICDIKISDITKQYLDYLEEMEKAGLEASGINPDTGLVEIVEIEKHPFFIGVQYHPEYKSTVANPHPLFVNFVAATVKAKQK